MRSFFTLILALFSAISWQPYEAKSDYYSEGEMYSCKDLAQKIDLAIVNAKYDDIRRLFGTDPDTNERFTKEQRAHFQESYEWHRDDAAAWSQVYLVFCTKLKHAQNKDYLLKHWD